MEFIGGQAVIEGVLMKSGSKVAIAVRDPEGQIKIKEEKHTSITKKYKLCNIPFIRGPIILFETTILGLKALNYSANMNLGEKKEEKIGTGTIIATILFSLVFALALFKLVPLGVAQITANNFVSFQNRYLFNLLEGITKITILVYLFLPTDISFLTKYALRLALLPIIAGIGYEFIRISPKCEKNIFFKIIMTPGLLLQRLTTKEPNEEQLEVAKAALNAEK